MVKNKLLENIITGSKLLEHFYQDRMHSKIQPADTNDRAPSNGKQDSKTHRILQQTKASI
jgi:hypothetical protein